MVSTSTRLRGRTRWSAASRCPRWAAMGLLGYEPAQPSERTQRIWYRGRQLGAYVADQFEAKHGADSVIREKAVPWPADGLPLGELHTDVFVIPLALPVEVKSTASPQSLLDSALTQLAGEVHFDPDAQGKGALVIVNPSNLEEETLPFVLTDQWRETVENIADQVATAGRTGTLPDCSCGSPTECRYLGCPFTEEAWEGWEPPQAGPVEGEVAALIVDLYQADRKRKEASENAALEETTFREIKQRLEDLGVGGGQYGVGPLVATCTEVTGRETFSLAKARKTGVWSPLDDERLGAFVSIGEPHRRWSFKRVGDGPLGSPEDFGEAPF